MRLSKRKKIAVVVTVCLAIALGAGALYLARPASGELLMSGHEQPAHAVEARFALATARVYFRSLSSREGAELVGLVSLSDPLPNPASRGSVFAATRDEGDYYLAAFYRNGVLAGVVPWRSQPPPVLDIIDEFGLDVPGAEQLLTADFGCKPDAIRYVRAGNGIWVVARSGGRERGVFVDYGGQWDCWPRGGVYSGAAVLSHLQHNEDHHTSSGSCTDETRRWE